VANLSEIIPEALLLQYSGILKKIKKIIERAVKIVGGGLASQFPLPIYAYDW